jgi:hypothetical protein
MCVRALRVYAVRFNFEMCVGEEFLSSGTAFKPEARSFPCTKVRIVMDPTGQK